MTVPRIMVFALILGIFGCATVGQAAPLVFEAESYTWLNTSMHKVADEAVSEGTYMEIPLQRPHGMQEGKPFDDGSATFKIYISQPGSYWLWARAHWHDGWGNSFFVMVDDLSTVKARVITDATY